MYVLLWWGVGRPPSSLLSCYSFPMGFHASGFWYWVMPGSLAGLLSSWHQWLGKHYSEIWNLVPGCLMWIVWLGRNRRSCEDKEKTMEEFKILCQRNLMEWFRCWGFIECFSLSEFMPSLSLVSWLLSCYCVVLCCVAVVLCCCSSSWTSCNSHLFFSLFNISFLITYQKKKISSL